MRDTITTARLLLVPFTMIDVERLLNGIRQPDWSPGYPTEGDLEIAQMVAQTRADSFADDGFGPYKIVERASATVIGGAGFVAPPGSDGAVEIGYGLAPEWRNRDIATEAVRGLLEFAWSHPAVERVFARTDPSNLASARVLEKAGMSFVRIDAGLRYYERLRR